MPDVRTERAWTEHLPAHSNGPVLDDELLAAETWRRFGGAKGSLARGRAVAGLPMYLLVSSPNISPSSSPPPKGADVL